jgi:hypothetical protein
MVPDVPVLLGDPFAEIEPLTLTVPDAKSANIPPVDPSHGFAVTVTPGLTVTFEYCGTTRTWATLLPAVE